MPTPSSNPPALLFTAFEPSGDHLAAPVIAKLKAIRPGLPIVALGGQRMAAAGATLLETTGGHAVMSFSALKQAAEHRRRLKRLAAWLAEHPIAALIPVDSPAANWSICKLVRKTQPTAKVLHLVAPQIWAWARWRIHKLRRLTDHVLSILPFEPDWLANRDVPATFVGHPLYTDLAATIDRPSAITVPGGEGTGPRLALLPGSRASEHHNNWPMMLETYERLAAKHPGLTGIVAAVDERAVQRIASIAPPNMTANIARRDKPGPSGEPAGWPASLHLRINEVDDIFRWCDAVLVVSGTATLHAAVFQKPMVVVYNARRLTWDLIGRFVVNTRTFSLPNLIAESEGRGRIVPEFAPHFGEVEPVEKAVDELLRNPAARDEQKRSLDWMGDFFRHIHFADRAAEQIANRAGV